VALRMAGQAEPGRVRLSTHGGQGELTFRFAHEFTVEPISREKRVRFEVRTSLYQYRILDFNETEIIIYDWHPFGASSVATPHLHVSAAGSIVLQQRAGSKLANPKTHIGSFHLPTSEIVVEDIVELLIREFLVDPRRPDWEAVLRANRVADERDHGSLNLL
jgi:hypothetical protein